MAEIVRLENVTKIYRQGKVEVQALKGIDLSIEKGDFIALMGPSGSGKTTLINMIGGLDRPTSGRVFLDREEISSIPDRRLSLLRLHKIGFIFQAYNLIEVLTARENAEFVLLLQKRDRRERERLVREAMALVGIGGLENRLPRDMSGGQQQRVAIVRAIVSSPALILADEPTANVDSKTAGKILDLMKRLNKERGETFLFATHDPLVMERADRVIRLKDGEIADRGGA